jgi:hypothetical protein
MRSGSNPGRGALRQAAGRLLRLACFVVVAGCGSGDGKPTSDGDNSALRFSGDQRAIGQVVEDFATAVRSNDWDRICDDLYTANQRDLTQGLIADSCADEVADRYDDLGQLSVTVTEVEDQSTAGVTAARQGTKHDAEYDIVLVRDGRRWRVDSLSGGSDDPGPASGLLPPGLSPEERAAAEAVLAYDQALEDKDWSRICEELITEKWGGGPNCVDNLQFEHGDYGGYGLSMVTKVEVTTAAAAHTRVGENDTSTFTVHKEGGRWRIDSFVGALSNDN